MGAKPPGMGDFSVRCFVRVGPMKLTVYSPPGLTIFDTFYVDDESTRIPTSLFTTLAACVKLDGSFFYVMGRY